LLYVIQTFGFLTGYLVSHCVIIFKNKFLLENCEIVSYHKSSVVVKQKAKQKQKPKKYFKT